MPRLEPDPQAAIESRLIRVRVEKLKFIPPMMPTLVDQPPEAGDWILAKYFGTLNGWGCFAELEGGRFD